MVIAIVLGMLLNLVGIVAGVINVAHTVGDYQAVWRSEFRESALLIAGFRIWHQGLRLFMNVLLFFQGLLLIALVHDDVKAAEPVFLIWLIISSLLAVATVKHLRDQMKLRWLLEKEK